jgi:small-conductance mechanosensitive channel
VIGYPRHFLRVLWTVLIVITMTGVALIPGALELRWDMDVPLHLPPGSRIGVAALHALCAFLMLGLLGALYVLHMRMGWRHWQNIGTGLVSACTLAALALTGIGIYYLADEAASRWTSGLHIALSLLGVVAVALHYIFGRRIRIARLARRHQTGSAAATVIGHSATDSRAPSQAARPRARVRGG